MAEEASVFKRGNGIGIRINDRTAAPEVHGTLFCQTVGGKGPRDKAFINELAVEQKFRSGTTRSAVSLTVPAPVMPYQSGNPRFLLGDDIAQFIANTFAKGEQEPFNVKITQPKEVGRRGDFGPVGNGDLEVQISAKDTNGRVQPSVQGVLEVLARQGLISASIKQRAVAEIPSTARITGSSVSR